MVETDALEGYPFTGAKSWQIVAESFLDTSHEPEWHTAARSELAKRGITGLKRYLLVAFVGLGLWWNIFWWEWAIFTPKHLIFGWTLNALLILSVVIGATLHWYIGAIVFVALAIAVRFILLRAWKGSLY